MNKPASQRADYHRLPWNNPGRRMRERRVFGLVIFSYVLVFLLGVCAHALWS